MRRFSLPLALGAALGLLAGGSLPRAQAQAPKPEKVRFETVDQVDLEGTFYPGGMGRKSPTVILLHKLGGSSTQDNWKGVAEALQKQGCSVLSFDFRGHGRSTNVGAMFWNHPYNARYIKVKKVGGKMPTTISQADFMPGYIPYLTNDISAARMYLERRNDASECNVSNLILVGAEEGATLGALWVAAECRRYRLLPGGIGVGGARRNAKPESKDIVGCVWVGMSDTLGRGVRVTPALRDWLIRAGKTEKIPMVFLYGKNDPKGAAASYQFVKYIKPSYVRLKKGQKPKPGEPMPATFDAGADTKLAGSKLLSASLDTPDWISKKYVKDKLDTSNAWDKRESDKAPFIWQFMGRTIQAKNVQDKNLEPLPLTFLGLRP
jgi:pimeloyl-ACP methyl ester carboxylesterase